ncbi:MAG: hypothetical protein KME45_14765 [Stenomitos rutilans HA7619-LM2]|nr:hypothetical protein [Stenomitos rutilans HA7619-LM2]
MLRKRLLRQMAIVSLLWLGLSNEIVAVANPASVFTRHLDRIRQNLPPKFVMRLPSRIVLNEPADDEFIQTLSVRIATFDSPQRVTVGLYSCEDDSQFCRIGTFSAANADTMQAQQEYQQHIAAASPIQLAKTIRGYVLMGTAKHPSSAYASIMWQQDGMVYTISFANSERQNMLYMAVYMANNTPIMANNAVSGTSQSRP